MGSAGLIEPAATGDHCAFSAEQKPLLARSHLPPGAADRHSACA